MLKNAEPSTGALWSGTSLPSLSFEERGLKFCIWTPHVDAKASTWSLGFGAFRGTSL